MKKIVSSVLAVTLTVALTACGGGTSSPKDADGTTAQGEAKKSVSIQVTTTYAGNKVNDSSATSDETFKTRVLADFEAGAEPDVLFFFNGVDSNTLIEGNKVVSIEEIRKEYPDYATNMKDGMMGASPVDGKNYSVPVNGYWEAMMIPYRHLLKENLHF